MHESQPSAQIISFYAYIDTPASKSQESKEREGGKPPVADQSYVAHFQLEPFLNHAPVTGQTSNESYHLLKHSGRPAHQCASLDTTYSRRCLRDRCIPMRLGIPKPLRPSRLSSPQSSPRAVPPRRLPLSATFFAPSRHLAQVRPDHEIFFPVAFGPSRPPLGGPAPPLGHRPDAPPPDQRTLKLGKSKSTRVDDDSRESLFSMLYKSRSWGGTRDYST